MQNLDRRLAALESVAATDNRIDVIIRKIVSPGRVGAEIHRITAAGGDQQWLRGIDESEPDFQDRASREVHRNAKGVCRHGCLAWREFHGGTPCGQLKPVSANWKSARALMLRPRRCGLSRSNDLDQMAQSMMSQSGTRQWARMVCGGIASPARHWSSLKRRVTREVPRSAYGVAVLLECYAEDAPA